MRSLAAMIGDNSRRDLHDGLPIRISDIRDQDFARLELVQILDVIDDMRPACRDLVTDGNALSDKLALLLEIKLLIDGDILLALSRLRSCLDDKELA